MTPRSALWSVRLSRKPHHDAYYLFFTDPTAPTPRLRRRAVSTKTSHRREAEQLLDWVRGQRATGVPLPELELFKPAVEYPTLRQAVEAWWFAELGKLGGGIRQTTINGYRVMLHRWVYPALGDRPVNAIRREDLVELIGRMREAGLQPQTIILHVAVVRRFYNWTTQAGRLRGVENPAARLEGLINNPDEVVEAEDEVIRPFKIDEMNALLGYARTPGNRPCEYPILLSGFHAGLRRGEIFGLQIPDLDFDKRLITLRRIVKTTLEFDPGSGKFHSRLVVNPIKTHRRGRRERPQTVPMTTALCDALRAYLPERAGEIERRGWRPADEPWVFLNGRGAMWDPANYAHFTWTRLLRGAGIATKHSPHDMRHTFATILLAESRNLAYVQKRLRHRSIRSTEVYTRFLAENEADYMQVFDRLTVPRPRLRPVGGRAHHEQPTSNQGGRIPRISRESAAFHAYGTTDA